VNAQEHHGPAALLATMARTRLELAAVDLESHLAATARSLLLALIAVVVALVGFAFIGMTIIAWLNRASRIAAAAATSAAYFLLALCVAGIARARWHARPAAFAGVLRELERDRDALRGRL